MKQYLDKDLSSDEILDMIGARSYFCHSPNYWSTITDESLQYLINEGIITNEYEPEEMNSLYIYHLTKPGA